MKEIRIKDGDSNQRIDKFIKKYLNEAPLSFIYKTFRKKDVKVNDHWVEQSYILKKGDVIKIYVSDEKLKEFNTPKKIEDIKVSLDVIYEDENILIVNKDKGLLTHGDISEKRITLANQVLKYLYSKNEFDPKTANYIPSPVHRLDRNTSGLVIFAKKLTISQVLLDLLKEKIDIEKYYLTLVYGEAKESDEIDAPLIKNEELGLVKVDFKNKFAKNALTRYRLIDTRNNYSLLEVNLITGRTHQIRVHLAYRSLSLLGDAKYGNFNANKEFEKLYKYTGQFLHAYKIKFLEIKNENLKYLSNKTFVAPLPSREEKIVNMLNINLKKLKI